MLLYSAYGIIVGDSWQQGSYRSNIKTVVYYTVERGAVLSSSIDIRCTHTAAIITVSGAISAETSRSLKEALIEHTSYETVVLDLSSATYLNSTGIGVLLEASQTGMDIAVVIPLDNIDVRATCEFIELDSFVNVFYSLHAAMAYISHTCQKKEEREEE